MGLEDAKLKKGGRRGESETGQIYKLHNAQLGTYWRATWDWKDIWNNDPIRTLPNFHGLGELASDLRITRNQSAQSTAIQRGLDDHLKK